ncbi:hypothetical protein D3C78_1023710 [compost metagenome]
MFDTLLHLVQRIRLAAPAIHLCPAGNTRLHLVTQHVAADLGAVFLVVRHRMGAWADDGHVAKQHVDELRQFVQRSPANECPHFGNAVVVARGLDHIRTIFHHPHAAELPHLDRTAIDAITLLPEEHRPRRAEFHRRGNERHGNGNQAEDQRRQDDIFQPLDDRLRPSHRAVEDADGRHAIDVLAARMQQFEDEYVRNDEYRSGGIAQLIDQPANARLAAHRQGDVDTVDLSGSRFGHQLLQRPGNWQAQLALRQVYRITTLVVIKAQQIQAHPGRTSDIARQALSQRTGTGDGYRTGIEALAPQQIQGQSQANPIDAQAQQCLAEPLRQVQCIEHRHTDYELIDEQYAGKTDRPDPANPAQLHDDPLAAPGTVQLGEIAQQVEHYQREQGRDQLTPVKVVPVQDHGADNASQDNQQIQQSLHDRNIGLMGAENSAVPAVHCGTPLRL